MKKIIIFILLYFTNRAIAIEDYAAGDALYNWAQSGLIMRSEKSDKSSKIMVVPYKATIIVKEKYENNPFSVTEFEGQDNKQFRFSGYWVLIEYKNQIGYVFDGYLSKLPVFNRNEDILNFLKRNFGKSKYSKTDKDDRITETWTFSNGAIFTHSSEKAVDECIEIPNFSIQEAILLAKVIHSSKNFERSNIRQITKKNNSLNIDFKRVIDVGLEGSLLITKIKNKVELCFSWWC
jgi:hypothetical protein